MKNSTMRNMHKYEELLPQEFETELKKNPVVYCAFGPMEYHGLQNALGVDPVKAYEVCLRAAEISGGIVFPMVPVAPKKSLPLFKEFAERDTIREETIFPSLMTSAGICRKLYCELLEGFAEDLGFKVCVAFGGHGPAGTMLREIAADNDNEIKGMKLLVASSLSHNQDLIEDHYRELHIERIQHGGMWETAMNMGCNEEFVDLDVFDHPCSKSFFRYPEKAAMVEYPTDKQKERWSKDDWKQYYQSLSPSVEEIKKTTLEFGDKLLQIAAERIASEAKELLNKQ